MRVISHADDYQELSRPALRMRQFAAMIEELRLSADNTPDALLEELLDKTGYIRALEKNTQEDRTRIENVEGA